MQQPDPYDTATYYTADDAAELQHDDPEDVLRELVDDNYEPGTPIAQTVEECCPVTIYAYTRKEIAPDFGKAAVDSMLEDLDEAYWYEEHGDPDGEYHVWNETELEEVRLRFYSTMRECLKQAVSWQCVNVGKRTYTAKQVHELIRMGG